MERSTGILPSSSQHVSSAALCSEVKRNRLAGWSMLSPVRSNPQILERTNFCSSVQNTSRGRGWSSVVKLGPSFKTNAAVGDSSSHLPDSAEDEQTTKDHPPSKDGLLQWLRNFVARRAAHKEEYISQEPLWQAVCQWAVVMGDGPDLDVEKKCTQLFAVLIRLTNSLKRFGVAGILAYGLLNTVYYLVAFLFVWFYVAPSPGGLGFVPAAQRFLRIFATVWAGSQVTKLMRAAGALSLAPFVDRGLNWYTQRFNFKSRGTAFSFIVGACFGLAAFVFLVITTLWS